jgi:hemoglobin
MWLECIRYRFQLDPDQDCLELAQAAALQSLRHSPRCRSWRVLPSPTDPLLTILEVEWDAGSTPVPFRESEEFAALHAVLTTQVKALDEADPGANTPLTPRLLPGPAPLVQLAGDIVASVLREPELAWRFRSPDGSKQARLGLWVLEVLGGPELFSSSFAGAITQHGPLVGEPLDLHERERFLDVARQCLPGSEDEREAGVLEALREHLPLYPLPPSSQLDGGEVLLASELVFEDGLLLEESVLLDPVPLGFAASSSYPESSYPGAPGPRRADDVPSSGTLETYDSGVYPQARRAAKR